MSCHKQVCAEYCTHHTPLLNGRPNTADTIIPAAAQRQADRNGPKGRAGGAVVKAQVNPKGIPPWLPEAPSCRHAEDDADDKNALFAKIDVGTYCWCTAHFWKAGEPFNGCDSCFGDELLKNSRGFISRTSWTVPSGALPSKTYITGKDLLEHEFTAANDPAGEFADTYEPALVNSTA
jgi:hypothetical protein